MIRRYLFASVGFLLFLITCKTTFNDKISVFPGAKGFGIYTPAGRGGKIIQVTNLNSEGAGSLREALSTHGSRIIVFEVGGVIDLNKKNLVISEPFVTVAGQTAPSPGITIIRGGISISTHDVLIQHLRVRPGDAGEPKRSGWEPDGISTSGGKAYNVIIDHCSISWAVDENLSASGPGRDGPSATSHKITFSNCVIAEGLNDSSHKKGPHSKGSLIHDYCTDIAIIGNFYAHNVERNPYFKAFTTGVVVNNLIYNPGTTAIKVDYWDPEWQGQPIKPQNGRLSVVGNVMIHGQDTREKLALVASRGDVYLQDNFAVDRQNNPVALTSGNINILKEKPVWPEGFQPMSATEVIDYVTKHVGARPRDRDHVDLRLIREFNQREGRVIDSQDDVGGYPQVEMTRRKLNTPNKNVKQWLLEFTRQVE